MDMNVTITNVKRFFEWCAKKGFDCSIVIYDKKVIAMINPLDTKKIAEGFSPRKRFHLFCSFVCLKKASSHFVALRFIAVIKNLLRFASLPPSNQKIPKKKRPKEKR